MKVALISDLHLHKDEAVGFISRLDEQLKEIKPDLILNAGDYANTYHPQIINQVDAICRSHAPYAAVNGNHDHYLNQDFIPEHNTFDFILKNDVVVIFGTMWTNYFGGDPYQILASRRGLSDFRFIPHWSTERQINHFNNSFAKLNELVKHFRDDKKIVILTHHAPSTVCIHPRFAGSALNGSFVNQLEDFILDNPNINVWAHGHVHDDVDKLVGETRILCHPRGYRHEVNYSDYKPKVFEV